jgi:hypothetical protein
MIVAFTEIPTYDILTDKWSETNFDTQEHFAVFLDSIWSDDCEYGFTDETSIHFRKQAAHFDKHRCYTFHSTGSKERKDYWFHEGKKCVRGVIYKQGEKTWYLTRDYYFFLNFLQFANKEKGDIDTFPDIRDIQYHLALYEKRAEAHHKHAILTKKRQMASSLFHCAKIINKFWFDRNAVNKIFASDEKYINIEDGIWKFLDKYRDFLNEHTDWKRHNQPNQEFSWMQQKIVKTKDGQELKKGRKSVISGLTLKIKPTNGVGGACAIGYHEEAGIAPKLHETYGYFRPATEAGIYTTGIFIAAGSVGDLKQCEPLKKYMYAPTPNRFLAVKNSWVDKNRVPTDTGLFIPEHWGMPGFVDKNGNSLSHDAHQYLANHYEKLKNEPGVSEADYQLELSQHPIFLKDAFTHREVSEFPVILLGNQQERIELKDRENKWAFKPLKGLLEEKNGKVVLNPNRKGPEHEYPIKPAWEDKRGVVTIFEMPDENPEWLTYFAGVDTIEADDTKTSESVFAIDIFKTIVEVRYKDKDGKIKTRIEGDKLVATYRGRFGSNDGGVDATNEQGWLLLKMFNAFAFVERSKPNFINYMQRNGRAEKYLAKESDVPMFKDLNLTAGGKSKFGFHMSPNKKDDNMWKLIKSYIKEYLLTEYDRIYIGNTEEVQKIIRGVDKIDDYWLLEELIQFNSDGNFDRVVSFGAAVMIAKIYQQNRFIKRKNEVKREDEQIQARPPRQLNMLGGGVPQANRMMKRKGNRPQSLL